MVSSATAIMRIHPIGGLHEVVVAATRVSVDGAVTVCVAVGVSLCIGEAVIVGVGKLCGSVAGICVGVEGGGNDSARASMIPPTTKTIETIAMIKPKPNWRSDCIITSPCLQRVGFWQWVKAH